MARRWVNRLAPVRLNPSVDQPQSGGCCGSTYLVLLTERATKEKAPNRNDPALLRNSRPKLDGGDHPRPPSVDTCNESNEALARRRNSEDA